MLKLVIIDWNGTAFDDREITHESVCEIFRRYNVPPPQDEFYMREVTADYMIFYHQHGIPKSATREDLNAIREEYFRKHWDQGELRDGVRKLLSFCRDRDIKTAIVSAEIGAMLLDRCRQLYLPLLVDLIRGDACDKREALRSTLAFFGVKPEETIYIDDITEGIRVAKAESIRTIGFTAGYNSLEQILGAQPNFPDAEFPRVDSFHTVLQIIKAQCAP